MTRVGMRLRLGSRLEMREEAREGVTVTVRARVKEAVAKVAKAASAAERGGAASTEGGW